MGSSLQKWKLKMNMDEIEVIEVSTYNKCGSRYGVAEWVEQVEEVKTRST